ncbi:MAG: hypothetical protein GY815_04220 [Gammaproteobacteria bacterium]|nr:hypothetical protein [Gammaproteobacteria bacterium]
MADGRDDKLNYPPNRGSKLRSLGSKPTGSQGMSFTPDYSEEMDYIEGGMTDLNQRTRIREENHSENFASSDKECCQESGLILKQPL